MVKAKKLRKCLFFSMKWIHLLVSQYILFWFDSWAVAYKQWKTFCGIRRAIIRFARTGTLPLRLFMRQFMFASNVRYFWHDRCRFYTRACDIFLDNIMSAVEDFKAEKSLNPWQLVVLFFSLNRFLAFVVMYMRASWCWLKTDQKAVFFQFMHNHHQEWFPDENNEEEDDEESEDEGSEDSDDDN